jgi:hypothetical protein
VSPWRGVPWRHGPVLWSVALLCGIGCTRIPAAPGPAPEAAQPLVRAELSDYVPAAGLRWLVAGSPRYFARAAALAPVRAEWLTDDRLRAFARATGIDLERTERALVAGYDLGTLYVVDGSAWTQPPERPFIEHLAGSAVVHREGHLLRVSGVAGSIPETLVRVDEHLVAVAVRDPLLAKIVELRALGRLGSVVPALRGAALSTLPPELLVPGPLRVYAPGPFSDTSVLEGSGLVAAAEAITAAVEIEGDVLVLRIALAGAWQESTDRERLLGVWQAVASSALGSALGLERAPRGVSVEVSPRLLQLVAKLDALHFFEGVRQLAGSGVDQLLGEESSPGPRPTP